MSGASGIGAFILEASHKHHSPLSIAGNWTAAQLHSCRPWPAQVCVPVAFAWLAHICCSLCLTAAYYTETLKFQKKYKVGIRSNSTLNRALTDLTSSFSPATDSTRTCCCWLDSLAALACVAHSHPP